MTGEAWTQSSILFSEVMHLHVVVPEMDIYVVQSLSMMMIMIFFFCSYIYYLYVFVVVIWLLWVFNYDYCIIYSKVVRRRNGRLSLSSIFFKNSCMKCSRNCWTVHNSKCVIYRYFLLNKTRICEKYSLGMHWIRARDSAFFFLIKHNKTTTTTVKVVTVRLITPSFVNNFIQNKPFNCDGDKTFISKTKSNALVAY